MSLPSEYKKLGVYSFSRQRKNYYRSMIASFSGFGTIWFEPAAPGLIKTYIGVFDPSNSAVIF